MSPKSPESTRGLVVLLLGGVMLTMVVRAVEGQGTRDPVSQPTPPVVAGDSSGVRPLDGTQVAMALKRRGGQALMSEAIYSAPASESSATYKELDAWRMRQFPTEMPDSADRTSDAEMARDWLKQPRKWGRVALPAEVREVLGDAEVYLVSGGGGNEEIWGFRAGRHYLLPPDLNQLTFDAGFHPDHSNLERLMRVYSVFVFAADRVGRYTGEFESAVAGQIPVVRPFRLRMMGARLITDKGPRHEMEVPKYTSGIARAVVDWGDRQDTVALTFAGSVGIDEVVFPYEWTTGDGMSPYHGFRRHTFSSPSPPPGKRGATNEDVQFSVDLASSSGDVRQRANGDATCFPSRSVDKPGRQTCNRAMEAATRPALTARN